MSENVIATVIFRTTPEATESCIDALRSMFPVTRTFQGFRNIQLVRSAHDPDELALLQEWDSVEDHQVYMKHRTETGDMEKLFSMAIGTMQLNYWIKPALAEATA